jgi:hypothetical protein
VNRFAAKCMSCMLFAPLLVGAESRAQTGVPAGQTVDVAVYIEELTKRDRQIEALQRRYDAIEQRLNRIEASAASGSAGAERVQAGPSPASAPGLSAGSPPQVTASATARLETDARSDQDRLIRNAFENTMIDRGGLLLPAGSYDLEASATYVHSSSENIVVDGFTIFPVLVVGDIVSERLTRDINTLNLTFRLGLPWDSQAEIRIPYGHQSLRSYSADGSERELNDNGLGDIELTFAHQLYRGSGRWPDVVANLRWKSKSGPNPFSADEGDIFVGAGYSATSASVNVVKVIDPVVYFGGLSYTHNHSTQQEVGRFDPGDSWGFNIGMALALNLNNSLSFAYDQQFTKKSTLDDKVIPGSYASTGVFSIGTSFLLNDNWSMDLSLGVGVTEDSPDLLFTTSFPLRSKF